MKEYIEKNEITSKKFIKNFLMCQFRFIRGDRIRRGDDG